MAHSASKMSFYRTEICLLLGAIIFTAVIGYSTLIFTITKKALQVQASQQLLEKAQNAAALLDTHIQTMYGLLEGIASLPAISEKTAPFTEKVLFLEDLSTVHKNISRLYITDMNGTIYTLHGTAGTVDPRSITAARQKKRFITEPVLFDSMPEPVCIVSVPVYYDGKPQAILCAEIAAQELSDIINTIQVAQTGIGALLGPTGIIIAHRDFELVKRQMSIFKDRGDDSDTASSTHFFKWALSQEEGEGEGTYTFLNKRYMAAFASLRTADWTAVVHAPEAECLFVIQKLSYLIALIGIPFFIISSICIFIVSGILTKRQEVKPEQL